MERKDYLLWYAALEQEFSALRDQRIELEVQLQEISKKMEHIQSTMNHLAPLAGTVPAVFEDIKDLGITDAVRSVLDPTKKKSATEVRNEMQTAGFDFSKYVAPDATVRTILKRLVDAEKAYEEKEGHKVFYRYKPTDEEIPF